MDWEERYRKLLYAVIEADLACTAYEGVSILYWMQCVNMQDSEEYKLLETLLEIEARK